MPARSAPPTRSSTGARPGDEVDYAVNDSGAKVLVVGSELMPTIEAIRDRLAGVEHVVEVTPDGGEGDAYECAPRGGGAACPGRPRSTRTTCAW